MDSSRLVNCLMSAAGRRRLGLVALCVLLLAGCGDDATGGTIVVSGFIEGVEVLIAPEVGGRVAEVLVEEGEAVAEGQVLLRLDDALLQSQRGEALAGVVGAEANLARVLAGPRPSELAAARAALTQAEALRDGAMLALDHTRQALTNPQELNARIVEAETQVALAEQGVESARADLSETELRYGVYSQQGGEVERAWSLSVASARAALEAAEARLQGARRYLAALYAIRARPLELQAQVHAAEAESAAAEAAMVASQAALDELEAGPTAEEVAVAQGQLHQAQAALAIIDAQLTQLTLMSPIDGLVASRSAHVGATAAPGISLLAVADLDPVTLVVYIPENWVGRVRIGQLAEVTVDSFPDRVFPGRVSAIASEAEFTPRSVQTQEERVNLVFAVEIVIPNPEQALKPGMPADATIHTQ
jgi:HlyD family secretion protein